MKKILGLLLVAPLLIACSSSSNEEDAESLEGLIGHFYGEIWEAEPTDDVASTEFTWPEPLQSLLDSIKVCVNENDSTVFGGVKKADTKTTAYDLYLATPTSRMKITTDQERDSVWYVRHYVRYSYPAGKYLPQGLDTIEIRKDGIYHRGSRIIELNNFTKTEKTDIRTITKPLPSSFEYTGTLDTQQRGQTYRLTNDTYTFDVDMSDGKCNLTILEPEQYVIGELSKK